MPAVLDAKAEKNANQVDEQLAQATSRIRVHDLAFGAVVLVAMLLVYAVGMIVLDKFAVLPEWVRQLSLVGFLGAAGAVAWFTIGRTITRRVNPLYAAVQVEKTIDDAKNSVVGYVEASENGQVHPAVKAAMGARAAKSVADADVNHAVDHRSLMYAGGVAIVFLLALVALFFVFRPAQFKSLAARTFTPFSSEGIAQRTQLTLVEPASGDATITTGQSITVKVNVAGSVPSPANPDRLRVLVRHNLATPDYEEVPMERGENSREWLVRVPDHLVRNGFWYKVAGGDAETAEYQVGVRTLPLFTDFDVTYEFPAYTRMKPETSHDPHLRAIRGTKVTITGKANRAVKDGRLAFDPVAREPIPGRLMADRPDAIQFAFMLMNSGHYRTTFTSTDGERSPEPPPFKIQVDEDHAPSVDLLKPDEGEIVLPANGQLAVDGLAVDDFGLESMTLKLKLVEPMMLALAPHKYQDGKSLRRTEKDGSISWPTNLDFKGSVDFSKLADEGGQPVAAKEGMVIEYWLEATDNRTKPGAKGPEADPSIGKSLVKRVRLGPPVVDMDDKKNLDQKKDQRKNEEQAHAAQQQKRLDNEKRDPQQPNGGMNEPQPPMIPPMGDMNPPPKGGMNDPMMPPMPKGGMNDPMMPPMPKGGMNDPMMPPMPMNMGGMNDTAPPPASQQDRKDQDTADKIQQKLNDQKGGGSSKPGPSEEKDQANPAQQKPMDMMGGSPPPDAGSKEPPKEPMNGAAEPKPMGGSQPPKEPGETKPDPSPMNMMGGNAPAESKTQPKNMDPMTGGAGAEKPQPKEANPMPMDGGKPEGTPEPGMNQPKPSDGAGKTKPMPQQGPAEQKPEPQPGNPMDKPQDGGSAKPQSAPPPADAKPGPEAKGMPMPGGASEPKPNDMGMGGGEPKPDMSKPNAGGAQPDKSNDKPSPGGQGQQRKPTPEEQKQFEQDLKDLAGKDPAKQQAARERLDKSVGKENRQDIEKGMKDFEKDVENLNSKDQKTREQAQKNLDKSVGQQNRKDIEDVQKGLNSNDPMERAKAEEKLKNLQQKAGAGQADQQPRTDKQPDPNDVEQAMKDLQSPDPAKRDAAKKELDKTFGKGAGDKAEQLQKDLKSDDMAKRDAAKKELDEMQKKAGGAAQNTPPKKEPGKKVDSREVENALDDVASGDPMKKAEGKKKLDDMLGKGAGDKAEKMAEDMKSDDFKKQADARKQRDDLLNRAEQMAKGEQPKPKQPSKEEFDRLEKNLKDLQSPDEAKRKQAEKELDQQIGEQARKEIQEAMKDPKKAEDLKKKLDELKHGGGDPSVPVNEAMIENAKDRAESAQLQLENFEKNKDNKDLLKELNMTEAEYQAFLDRFKKHADSLKKEADDLANADPTKVGPTINVGEGRKIESKNGASTGTAGGPTIAAPGYSDALKEFNKGAAKAPPRK